MKILAVESASRTASAAFLSEDGLLGEFTLNNHKTHSETLLPMVDAMLSAAGTGIEEIDAVAVSAGPGSFTGLRIGISLAKGLAFALGKPVVAVPTLDAAAYGFEGSVALLCPLMDARRGEVYAGIYAFENGEFRVIREAFAAPLSVFLAAASEEARKAGRPLLFLGDGLSVYEQAIRETLPDAEIALPHVKYTRAGNVAALGLKLFREGKAVSPEELSPVYLRMSQAERERLEEGLSVDPVETVSIEPVNKKIGE